MIKTKLKILKRCNIFKRRSHKLKASKLEMKNFYEVHIKGYNKKIQVFKSA